MKIKHSAHVQAPPNAVAHAATLWIREEAGGVEPEVSVDADGRRLFMVELISDNVLISSGFIVTPAGTGSDVAFVLEMRGTTALSRFRNLGMNIARTVVARESKASFRQFIDSLEG